MFLVHIPGTELCPELQKTIANIFKFYLTMCSKKALAFVNMLLSPFEQIEVDYAARYKTGDTHNLAPTISNSPPKPGTTVLNEDQLQHWYGHVLSLAAGETGRQKGVPNLSTILPRKCSFYQTRAPDVSLHHHLLTYVFVILDELLVLALKCTQNRTVAETSPSKETARKKHDRYLDQV